MLHSVRVSAMKSLAKNSIFNVLYNFVALIFPLITAGYIARVLQPDGVGHVAYAQNFASYFVEFVVLGLPIYGVREISKAKSSSEESATFSELVFINFVWALVVSVCYLMVVFKSKSDVSLFLACGIPIFLNFLNVEWYYQGKEEYVTITLRSITIKLLSLIAIFSFVKTRNDVVVYALITSVASVGNYLFNIIHSRKFVSLSFRHIRPARHLKPLFILAFVCLLSVIYGKIDISMLNYFTEDSSIGFYANSQKIIEVVLSVCNSITATFLPRLCFYCKEDRKKLAELLDAGFGIITFIAVPAAFGLYLVAPSLISVLFGNEFIPAVRVVRIFVPMIIIRSYGDLFCYRFLIAEGLERLRLYSDVMASVVNFVLNMLLIPKMAERGAAIASVSAELTLTTFLLIYLFSKGKLSIDWKMPLLKANIASFVMFAVVYPIRFFKLSDFSLCTISVLCGVLVYFCVNFLLKNEILYGFFEKIRNSLQKNKE